MIFQQASPDEFDCIRDFYWNLIDMMQEQNDTIGWKKGIYPSDSLLKESLQKGELFTLSDKGQLYGCVILNSSCNEGYEGVPWSLECLPEEILVPHALAVCPKQQGQGIGEKLVEQIVRYAEEKGKKAIRLDILGTNSIAEKLYVNCGFRFVKAKPMFYEDTGWTEYKMYEKNLYGES